jgi:hypothetical protein
MGRKDSPPSFVKSDQDCVQTPRSRCDYYRLFLFLVSVVLLLLLTTDDVDANDLEVDLLEKKSSNVLF